MVGAIETIRDITDRKRTEEERKRLISDLREALNKVKTLSGLLPICASCKRIRNDKGYWEQIEVYIREHSDADLPTASVLNAASGSIRNSIRRN